MASALQREAITYANHLLRGHPYRARILKAMTEAGFVESGFRNLPSSQSDRDSAGFLQQRPSQGWGSEKQVRNTKFAVRNFVNRAKPIAGKHGNAGSLAQAVQRSAFPAKYGQRAGDAQRLIREVGGGSGGGSSSSGGGGGSSLVRLPGSGGSQPISGPADTALADMLGERLAQQRQPVPSMGLQDPAFSARKNLAVASGAPTVSSGPPAPKVSLTEQLAEVRKLQVEGPSQPQVEGQTLVLPGSSGGSGSGSGGSSNPKKVKGTAMFEGVRVAAWIKPELEYARRHGWKGKVNSGFRSRAEQTRIYNSGVRPAAKPGTSNHEGADYPRGAVDVSDAATLARILRRKKSPLKFAGAKDPVHFSHPHGGSY